MVTGRLAPCSIGGLTTSIFKLVGHFSIHVGRTGTLKGHFMKAFLYALSRQPAPIAKRQGISRELMAPDIAVPLPAQRGRQVSL